LIKFAEEDVLQMLQDEEADDLLSPGVPSYHATQTVRTKMQILHALVHLVVDTHPEFATELRDEPEK
jgi:hypothetical protein